MTPLGLVAALVACSLEDLALVVEELPRPQVLSLRELCDDRVWSDRCAALAPPAPVVVAAALDPDEILTAEEAAGERKVSLDTLYAMVERGEVLALPRPPKGRIKIRRRELYPSVANGKDQRYIPPHDSTRRDRPPPPTRLDATPTRGGPQRDRDDRRPLGTRRAGRDAARRNEPWAPGQGAWADPQGDPRPKGRGS